LKNYKKVTENYFRTLSKEEKNRNAWCENSDAFMRAARLNNFQNKTPNPKEDK
jgi:hypothetical protein